MSRGASHLLLTVATFATALLGTEAACPRCTTPDTAGSFNGHTFVPDASCYHAIPSVVDTFALLSGSWLFTCGGSNAWATFNALARQLEPTVFGWHDERYDGSATVWPLFADLV